MLINRHQKIVRESLYQNDAGPAVRKRVVKANIQLGGKIDQGEVAVIPQPMIGAAALAPLPAPVTPLPPLRLPLPPPVVPQDLPHLGEKGGVADPHHTNLAGVVEATARTDAAVTAMTKAVTGGGVLSDLETNVNGVTLGNGRAAGAGLDLEKEAETGVGNAVAAETGTEIETRTGKEIGSIERAATAAAANTRKPLAKRGRDGEREAIVMRKTKRKRTKTEKKSLTRRGRKLGAKIRSETRIDRAL